MGFEGRFDVVEEGDGEGVALVEVGDVAVEAGLSVFVGEEADVGEFPAEDCGGISVERWILWEGGGDCTVADEDDGLLCGAILGLRDVGLQAADFVCSANGLAFVDFA